MCELRRFAAASAPIAVSAYVKSVSDVQSNGTQALCYLLSYAKSELCSRVGNSVSSVVNVAMVRHKRNLEVQVSGRIINRVLKEIAGGCDTSTSVREETESEAVDPGLVLRTRSMGRQGRRGSI